MEQMYHTLFVAVLVFLALGVLFLMLRSITQKGIADRVICINCIGTLTILGIAILSQVLEESYLLDTSIIYALISFLAVTCLCKLFIALERLQKHEREEQQK